MPGYLSRWLHEHWQYLLQRIELHKNYEVSSGSDREDEVLKPRKGDSYTNVLYDEIFIPYQVGEAARESYLKTSYVNDVNRSYVQVLMEYGIEETKSEGITTRSKQEISAVYEYGLQRLSYEDAIGGEDFTYTYDGRGSTVNLTSQRGLSVISYVYDAYGTASAYSSAGGMAGGSIGARTGTGAGTDAEEEAELLPGGRNPYLYNGEAVDRATGFQYLRSRYYSSNTGSFLTQDTYGGSLRDPLSQNLYTYTGNDPVNLQDPSGHGWLSKAVSKVKSTVSKVTSAVKTAVQKVSSAAKKVVNTVKSTVKKTVTKAVVKTGVSAVSKAVKSQTTSSGKLQSKSKSSSKSQGKSQTSKGGTLSSRSTGGSVQTAASKASKNYGQQVSQVARKSNSPAPLNWKQKLAKSMGGSANNVRQVTTGHAYVNNKLLTATSENERKMCQKGATLTSAGLALEPSALEGISQTLMQMLAAAGTMMGTVVTGPEMLAGVAVGAGVYWTYQEWQKVGPIALVSSPASKLAANWKASQASSSVASTTFDILNEQIKELRKQKEEQETIHVGPGDENYEVVDTDGKVVYKGGGSGGNKKNDDDDDDLTPVAPEPENGGSGSGDVPEVSGGESQVAIDSLPNNVQESYYKYQQNGWNGPRPDQTPGTRAGGKYKNLGGQLPTMDSQGNMITYREFDVNSKIEGQTRDAERFVIGSDGSIYYTNDHYLTFIKIGG